MSKNNINLEDMPSMEELLGGQTNVNFQENTLVKGRVAEKTDKGVLLDIGYKAEALVDRQEIKNWDTIQVGDELEVYLEQIEDEENIPVVSIHKAELQKAG